MRLTKNTLQRTIRLYYLHNFLRELAFFAAVLVPFFTQWGGISPFQVQLLQSWFMLWVFLLEIPTGAVADYFGRKYSMALGAAITAIAALIYGSVPRFEVFLLAEFFFAAGIALTSGADDALLYDTLKEAGREAESKKIFAHAHTLTLSGIMVAAAVGGFMAQRFGLNVPMLFSAIPFSLACILALVMREPKIHQDVSESERYLQVVKKGVAFFAHHRQFRALAIDAIIVAAGGYFVIWLYQPLLGSINIPLEYFGMGHVALMAAEILIASNFTRLEKWFGGEKAYLRYCALLTAVPFFLVALFPNVLTIGLFILVSGGFGMTRVELMSSSMNAHVPSAQRATIMSSVSMFRRFVLCILNPVVGWLATGSLQWALLCVGLLPLSMFFFSPVKEVKEVKEDAFAKKLKVEEKLS